MDAQLSQPGQQPLVLTCHQEVWLPGDHSPVEIGHQLAEHNQGNTGDEHIVDIELPILLVS